MLIIGRMPNIDTSIDVPLRDISGKRAVYRNATVQDKGIGAKRFAAAQYHSQNAGLDRRLGELRLSVQRFRAPGVRRQL